MKIPFQGESVIESKIQGHLSYQLCFCINTVVTIMQQYFSCQSVCNFFWSTLYYTACPQIIKNKLICFLRRIIFIGKALNIILLRML